MDSSFKPLVDRQELNGKRGVRGEPTPPGLKRERQRHRKGSLGLRSADSRQKRRAEEHVNHGERESDACVPEPSRRETIGWGLSPKLIHTGDTAVITRRQKPLSEGKHSWRQDAAVDNRL